jgi:hypothetical protein
MRRCFPDKVIHNVDQRFPTVFDLLSEVSSLRMPKDDQSPCRVYHRLSHIAAPPQQQGTFDT